MQIKIEAQQLASRLQKLREKDPPRCTVESLKIRFETESDELRHELVRSLGVYLRQFVMPTDDFLCAMCGRELHGDHGTFTKGLEFGEGFCRVCQYPGRFIHMPRQGGVDLKDKAIVVFLQYHPSELTVNPHATNMDEVNASE